MTEQKWTTVVKSSNNAFNMDLKGLKNCKDLIMLFVRRTFVAKYKQTVLGPAWAVTQPFFTTVVYSVFFGNIAGLGAPFNHRKPFVKLKTFGDFSVFLNNNLFNVKHHLFCSNISANFCSLIIVTPFSIARPTFLLPGRLP